MLTGGSVIGVDLQVFDVRQTTLVYPAIGVLLDINRLVESCVDRKLGKLVFHVGRAHATPQVGQRLFRLVGSVPRQQPYWRFRGLLR